MEMDFKQLAQTIGLIAEEKNLPEETVQEIVEQALAAAYRRDYGDREQEVRATMNLNTGEVTAFVSKTVVEKVEDEFTQISLADAKKIDKNAEIDSIVEVSHTVDSFGRVAAQTAKQVILQRLRESEREVVLEEYEDKIGTMINGIVSRVEGNITRVDLGKAQGILPRSEQIQGERYFPGQRLKVFLKDVERGFRGPQLVLSRGNTQFIEALFRAEVPEMESESVQIRGIAREAGVRTKLAVASSVQGVDPVGTFVGGHGTRVNAVMSEIGEQEKIDIVVFAEDPVEYITNAMSPTRITSVTINENDKKAKVVVPEDQLSIGIGRGGQNVRLASKLTGYEIDITGESNMQNDNQTEDTAKVNNEAPEGVETSKPVVQKLKKKSELENNLLSAIEEHGE